MLNLLMKESVLHEGILNIFNDLIKTLDIRLNKKNSFNPSPFSLVLLTQKIP